MKNFSEWVKEKDPEVYNELFGALKKGIEKLQVGMKRVGARAEKLLGGDPHARQRGNRQKTKDNAEWQGIMKDM